jgi:hypothetical protein
MLVSDKRYRMVTILFHILRYVCPEGARGRVVVEALSYKPEGHGFEIR